MRLRAFLLVLILTAWAATVALGQVPPDVATAVAASTTQLSEAAKIDSTVTSAQTAKPPEKPQTTPAETPPWRNPDYVAATIWGSESCGPCRLMEPYIATLKAEGWAIEHWQTETWPAAARLWKVTRVPTLIIHGYDGARGRKELRRNVGYLDQETLRELLEESGVRRTVTTVPQPGAAPVPAATPPGPPGTAGPAFVQSGCASGSCGTRSWRSR